MSIEKLGAEQKALLAGLKERIGRNLDRDLTIKALGPLGSYLQQSEQQLIVLMHIPQEPPPPGGNIEFGLVLYWLHQYVLQYLPAWISNLFPPTQITAAILAQWKTQLAGAGVVMNDGTLAGFGFFEVLDAGWLFPFVLRLLQLLGKTSPLDVPVHAFGSNPYSGSITSQDSLKIAMMGDWGTGSWPDNGTQGPAAQIMQQIQGIQPDILIHLGDVYYSGTGKLSWEVNAFMSVIAEALDVEYSPTVKFDQTEETNRLVNPWWSPKQSFTLNSNHEMYSGANGYFPAVSAAPFAQQNGASYFMLTFQDWVILGLDSAYFSPDFLHMDGRLQSAANTSQVTWIQQQVSAGKFNNKKAIVLTHHNGLTYDGSPAPGYQQEPTLYADVYQALGRDPDYWYWGHIHNGIVYTGNVSLSPNKQTATLCRCVGHGALPFGSAYQWLKNPSGQLQQYPLDQTPTGPNPKIAYYAHTPLQPPVTPLQGPWLKRVKNGFTVLTLTAGSIKEEVYEQGTSAPVWTSGK